MFNYLIGKITEINESDITFEVGNVGYQVISSTNTINELNNKEHCTIYIYHHVREDIQLLFGFSSKDEKKVFLLLSSVNGIGVKTAINVLSALGYNQVLNSIAIADVTSFQRVSGIGKKIAERIVLELKDKVKSIGLSNEVLESISPPSVADSSLGVFEEAISALIGLGFSQSEARQKVKEIKAQLPENAKIEEIIIKALQS